MANTISELLFDVFLSHSANDRAVVRSLAERLRQDGPIVWFAEWVLAPGDTIPAKIEKGTEHSNILRNEGGRTCGCVTPPQPNTLDLLHQPVYPTGLEELVPPVG